MVFRQLGNGTEKFTKNMGLFSKSFSDIKKDLSNGLGLRKGLFSVGTKDDIKALNEFNKSINNGTKYSVAFNSHLSKAPIAIKRQANELINLHKQQSILNKQYQKGKITQQEYNTAMTANKAKMQALTTQTQTLTLAQRASAAASKALGIALNMALNVGFVVAINGIISGIMYLVNRQKEAIEKARESAEAIKQETDAIDEYINKTIELRKKLDEENVSLEESKDIRSELRSIQDDLIDKYGEEARGIDLVTGSIEDQARALYNLNKQSYQESYKLNTFGYRAAVDNIKKKTYNVWGSVSVPAYNTIDSHKEGTDNNQRMKFQHFVSKLFHEYSLYGNVESDAYTIDDKLSEVQDAIKDYLDNTSLSDTVKKEAQKTLDSISSYRRDVTNKTITDNEEMYSQWLKYDSDYSDEYINIVRKQANLEYAIENGNAEKIAKAKEEFAGLYQDTITKATEAGDTDVAKYLEKIFGDTANLSDDTADSITYEYVPAVKSLTDAYEDLEEQIEKILDLQSKLSDAFEKVTSGEVFTAEEAYNLLKEIPELYNSITPVEGGFTFSLDGLEAAYETQNDELINQIKENNKENQKVVDYYNKQKQLYDESVGTFSDVQMRISGLNPEAELDKSREAAEAAKKEIDRNNALLGIIDTSLDTHAQKIEGITAQYKTAKDEIDDFNSKISTIDKAITSMNDGEALTYDEMAALIEISPAIKSAFTEQGNGYYIAVDSLTALREESYTTRNSYIDDLIAMAEAEITSAEATKKALGSKINSWDSYISYTAEIAEVSAEISGWQDLINKLTALKGKVYETDSSSSSGEDTISDKLQQEIDYYDKIIQGIEAVADKRIEAIDKEIDAINEQKDALKEQNDERQRELDLIEAQNNLDKAKKQKVFVYKEGQGLVQVQDEKAVKDAQKELDDAQREIKEAEYDKQIELLEQQSNATEEYRDTFSDKKSDIEDAIAVEQAKSALGTDEKGLLDLGNSAIDSIQNGLAKAVVEKENEDNKGNPYYKDVTWADLMKKLGSNATMDEFKAKVYDPMMRSFSPEKLYNIQGGSNNQYITNNSPTTVTATFNISGVTDPNEVAKVVRTEITDLLQRTYNKVK